MTDSAFAAFTIVMCSRKRRTMAGVNSTLSGLKCTPLAPVDARTRETLGLNAPHVVFEIHLQGAPDIVKGDVMTLETKDYSAQYVEPWTWLPTGDKRLKVVVEDLTNYAV